MSGGSQAPHADLDKLVARLVSCSEIGISIDRWTHSYLPCFVTVRAVSLYSTYVHNALKAWGGWGNSPVAAMPLFMAGWFQDWGGRIYGKRKKKKKKKKGRLFREE